MTRPGYQHGRIMARVIHLLQSYLDANELGTVVGGDPGVITHRNPDTVRGPDVAYYSYQRLPRGEDPVKYPAMSPELVFEVKSPEERWKALMNKVGDYLNADVALVCVLDPIATTVQLYRPDEPVRLYAPDDEVSFAPVLPDWRVVTRRFFSL